MILTKTRCALLALAVSGAFAIAWVMPTASQAQWHNICYAGHCTTHTNYTINGKDPCTAINGNYSQDYGAYLSALQNQMDQADMVDPTMTPSQTQQDVNDREAQIAADQRAAFEWGCSLT